MSRAKFDLETGMSTIGKGQMAREVATARGLSRALGALALGAAAACGTRGDAAQGGGVQQAATLVAHPSNVQPGLQPQGPLVTLRNPLEGDAHAREVGEQLFIAYNCIDCHGGGGSGAMGPALNDGRWHFGGSAGEVFESIAEGRPDGMPSWGGRITDSQIWALVTYVRSLAPSEDVSTENFEGSTVERGGH